MTSRHSADPSASNLAFLLTFIPGIADKGVIVTAPIASHFLYDSSRRKEKKVVCVGRWSEADMFQKRPIFLIDTIHCLLEKDSETVVEVYGKVASAMLDRYEKLPTMVKERTRLMGFIEGRSLPDLYSAAMISLCPSRYESTHLASLEALCCGCSVVTVPRAETNVVQWYTSYDSGTVAEEDTPESLADAILTELQLWENGQRDPKRFATFFQDMVRVDKVVQRLFGSELESE